MHIATTRPILLEYTVYKYGDLTTPACTYMRSAVAARHAHNLLVAENRARGDRYRLLRDHLTARGLTPTQVKAEIKRHDVEHPDEPVRPIGYQAYATQYLTGMIAEHRDAAERIEHGEPLEDVWADERYDEPWMHEISRRIHVSGLQHADAAIKAWFASITGSRKGRRMGAPRFKQKGCSRDSFTIPAPEAMGPRATYHRTLDVNTGAISDNRHVRLAALGTIRTHDTTKRLVRALDRGAQLRSFTVSRSGPAGTSRSSSPKTLRRPGPPARSGMQVWSVSMSA